MILKLSDWKIRLYCTVKNTQNGEYWANDQTMFPIRVEYNSIWNIAELLMNIKEQDIWSNGE